MTATLSPSLPPAGRPVVRRTHRRHPRSTPLACPLCRCSVPDTPRAVTEHLLGDCSGWWATW